METKRLHGSIRRIVTPQAVDEGVVGHEALRPQGQERKQRPLLFRTNRHRSPR